jgi:hypothetical protein
MCKIDAHEWEAPGMTSAVRLPDGSIRAPRTAEGPGGEAGDGLYVYRPGEPGFDLWDDYLRAAVSAPPGGSQPARALD